MHGRVVDMFYIDIWQGVLPESIPIFGGSYLFLWPIFNVADAAISVGIVVILIYQKQYFENLKEIQRNASEEKHPQQIEIPQENPH
jgi:signal peptidase II